MALDLSNSAARYVAQDGDAGVRLDRFLASRIETLSRARLQDLIRGGHVTGGGQTVTDPSLKVREGDRFEVDVPAAE
ncbi:MAG: RNA pseudouridine synthase, partial [Rhodomicrobium sp.]|nr:RNA pseudouridine synthase [Rhodomicrobium sp.]